MFFMDREPATGSEKHNGASSWKRYQEELMKCQVIYLCRVFLHVESESSAKNQGLCEVVLSELHLRRMQLQYEARVVILK